MKESKTEMEDLLARSVDLQKRQQLLPQEKVLVGKNTCFTCKEDGQNLFK